jgi:oxygen-independent coproporphyrinogen-3 oxidase
MRGHLLSDEDRALRQQILQFMTQLHVSLEPNQIDDARAFLAPMIDDGIVTLEGRELRLLERGKPFLRNATCFFDRRLRTSEPRTKIFSMAL